MAVSMTPMLQTLDWCGSALGLIGAYTLAFRFSASRYGWLAFFAANAIYIVMASSLGLPGLLARQIGFIGSSTIGIYRHFVARTGDRLEAARDRALRISLQLAQLSADADDQLPAEVVRLVQSARRLHSDLASSAPLREERRERLAVSPRG